METKIYFVRHAAVNYIPDDFIRPLSEKGRQDAKKVTGFFEDKRITKVISSPYMRAIDTIKGAAHRKKLEIETIKDCRERKVANEHIDVDDFFIFAKKQWSDFDFRLEGGESLNQVQKRAVGVVNDLLDRFPGEKIILGTHGTWLGVLLNYFDDKYDYYFWESIKMPDIFLLVFQESQLESITNFQII